jgi:ribosomal protein S6
MRENIFLNILSTNADIFSAFRTDMRKNESIIRNDVIKSSKRH